MQRLSRIVGFGLLLAVSGLQAESGGLTKDQEMDKTQATVMISLPADGAVLTAFQPVKVSYKATLGLKGDHLHLYIDGFQAAVLHQLTGEHEIKMLHPGMHKISIEIVNKERHHIGVGKEINVDVRY